MEIEQRILARAEQLFMQKGVKSISMDDIASDLGISKKTIYQYFSNKAELVYEISKGYFAREKAMLEEISRQSGNALEELVKVVHWSLRFFQNIHPGVMFDIRKYYPRAWSLFEEYKSGFVLAAMVKNLEQGIREGLYRPDINVAMVARMRLSQIDACMDQQYFPNTEFDFMELQIQMLEVFMYGIVTGKGRISLKEYLKPIEKLQS